MKILILKLFFDLSISLKIMISDYIKKFIGICLFIAIPSCNFVLWTERRKFFIGLLPEEIEISDIRYISDDCFFGIFDLSNGTLSKIKAQGIKSLRDDVKARAYDIKKDRYNSYQIYQKWQKTPAFDADKNRGFGSGYSCVERDKNFDKVYLKKIYQEAYSQNSLFAGHWEGQLVIIPSLGIAVISGIGG